MKKIILILFSSIYMYASNLGATYKVSFGIFGQIGIAKTSLHVEGNKYHIVMHAKSTGFAAFVSGDREEWYESTGFIKDNLLIPNEYKKRVKNSTYIGDFDNTELVLKNYIKIYTLDHKNKKISYHKITTKGEQKDESVEDVPFYANNDLLSMFFNFKSMFPTLIITKSYTLYAVGADKKTGEIQLSPLEKENIKDVEYKNIKNLRYMKVILSDKIFDSKEGELYLSLDESGIVQKAVLKDVILFGDIRGELIEKSDK